MKKKLLILFLGLCLVNCYSQKRIKFTYDATGNQTQRSVCINCPLAKVSNDSIKDLSNLTEEDLIKHDELEEVKYYPNPVLEELYIKWYNTDVNYVTGIDLYSLNGQLIKQQNNLKNQETTKIAFYNLPEGYYNVILMYSNGDRKTLKIVKQK